MGDSEGGGIGLAGVYGVREVEHGGPPCGFSECRWVGQVDRWAESAARARDEVERAGGGGEGRYLCGECGLWMGLGL